MGQPVTRPALEVDIRPGRLYAVFLTNLVILLATLGIGATWARARLMRCLTDGVRVLGHRPAILPAEGMGAAAARGLLLALLIAALFFSWVWLVVLDPERLRQTVGADAPIAVDAGFGRRLLDRMLAGEDLSEEMFEGSDAQRDTIARLPETSNMDAPDPIPLTPVRDRILMNLALVALFLLWLPVRLSRWQALVSHLGRLRLDGRPVALRVNPWAAGLVDALWLVAVPASLGLVWPLAARWRMARLPGALALGADRLVLDSQPGDGRIAPWLRPWAWALPSLGRSVAAHEAARISRGASLGPLRLRLAVDAATLRRHRLRRLALTWGTLGLGAPLAWMADLRFLARHLAVEGAG